MESLRSSLDGLGRNQMSGCVGTVHGYANGSAGDPAFPIFPQHGVEMERLEDFERVLLEALFSEIHKSIAEHNPDESREALVEMRELLSELEEEKRRAALSLIFTKAREIRNPDTFSEMVNFLTNNRLYDS
jgi:hypothetical protein